MSTEKISRNTQQNYTCLQSSASNVATLVVSLALPSTETVPTCSISSR